MTAELVSAPFAGEQALQQCQITILHAAEDLATNFVLQASSVVRLGRAASNDVVLKDTSASGHHAQLFLRLPGAHELNPTYTQELCIRDCSRNGTGVRPPPSADGSSAELASGLDRLGWERLPKGGVRKLADGWQLKLPLRSRRGDRQVPEAQRTWSLRVRFVDVQAPQVPASRRTSGGDAKFETVRKRKKDKGLETDDVEPKKTKRGKKANDHMGVELPLREEPSTWAKAPAGGDTVPTEQSSLVAPCTSQGDGPGVERETFITERQQVATASGADDEAARVVGVGCRIQPLVAAPPQDVGTGISSAPRTERPLGRKEQWERKKRERLERERAARESGGITAVPADDQTPVGAAQGEQVAVGQVSLLLPSKFSLACDGDPSQKSVQPARVRAGGSERVDSSPEGGAENSRGYQVEAYQVSAPTPPLAAVVDAPDGGPHAFGGVASIARPAFSTIAGAGEVRLTEAAVKAVATAAAAARGQRHERQAAEAWRSPGLSIDRIGLVGQSLLRDMSISPISTPGVGRKNRRKHIIPDQSSSDNTATVHMEAKRRKRDTKKKKNKKKKKRAETETGATQAVRENFGMIGTSLAHSQRPTHTSGSRAAHDGHARVVANLERGASPERWNPSPPPMAHGDERPSRRKEPSRLPVHGPALAANATAPAKGLKVAEAAMKDKDKSSKSARDQVHSRQAKRKRSQSAGKEARKRDRQRRV